MITTFKDFLLQFAVIAVLMFYYQNFYAAKAVRSKYDTVSLTLLFGISTVLCMSFPFHVLPDYRIDIRAVPLLLGTLYGGRKTGIVLCVIIIGYRSYIGVDLGLYTTVLALLFGMPVFLIFQKAFTNAKKKARMQIALALLLYYTLVGITTVCLVRGIPLAAVLEKHAVHMLVNLAAMLMFIPLNEMIGDMMRNNRQLQADVKNAEIAFLRSQIKPHFLYNTLNSISVLCIKDPRRAEQLTLEFAMYLRRSFDFKQLDSLTTLEKELELAQAYLNIEKVRFGTKLSVEFDIDADPDMRIPPLVLQPLIENAVRHGLMANLQGGTVKLTIRKQTNGVVRFTVADNGCGMDETQLKRIREPVESMNGVGLWNICQRISLIYGTSVHVESAAGVGTTVYFEIPERANGEREGRDTAESDDCG